MGIDKDKAKKEELERVLALLLMGIQIIRKDGVKDRDRDKVAAGLLKLLGMITMLTGADAGAIVSRVEELQARGDQHGEGE